MEQKNRRMTKEELEAVEAARKAARDMLVMMAFAVIMIIIVAILTIVFVVPAITSDKKPEETETTVIQPKTEPVPAFQYELKQDQANVYIRVDGSSTGDEYVNVRSEPGMSTKYKVGRLKTDTEFIVSRYYFYSDDNNRFVGFPADEVEDIIDVEDDDGVLWMSLFYLHLASYDLPETYESNDPVTELKDFSKLTIVGSENPNIRSTPDTTSRGNIYGTVPVGTVIEATSAILVNSTGTFYGVQLTDVEFAIDTVGYGHLWHDQDHVLWISKDYVKLT